MKKLLISLSLAILIIFSFGACKKKTDLYSYVSEARTDILTGSTKTLSLKAETGFKESPLVLDGIKNKTSYYLTIYILDGYNDNVTYSLTFKLNNIEYKGTFELSKTNSKLLVSFQTDSTPNELTISLNSGNVSETVELKSIKPSTTKSPRDGLNSLLVSQPELLSNYLVDGVFRGEIAVRLLVEENKAYYYVGLTDVNGKTKALLVNGETLEVLAIRQIF